MKSNIKISDSTICYHCGELCEQDAVTFEDKPFCCSGCKLVYEILDDNQLNTYYCLEDKPGVSFKNKKNTNRFDFLNDDSVVDKLADFRNNGKVSVSLYIPNIHCTSCVWLLENLFKLDNGITKSSVNFLKRELTVSYDENKTTLQAIVELLASIGYEPELRMEKLDKNVVQSPDRRLWLKLGFAGFRLWKHHAV
ncbi:MAG: heavy metal translocating P-type ATPase metal-binding domain-containing protein [Balneolaceae bacterium]|nr:heavy metal translocating P-type ATPase metal-binding domain-containing protein [Balneolaceae bacterium]